MKHYRRTHKIPAWATDFLKSSEKSTHVLTWAGNGSRYLAGRRCRSVPIWYAAAARWFLGSDKQNLFPAKDRLDSSTCTRHRGTREPSFTIYPGQIRRYRRVSSKSSNDTPSLTDLRCLQRNVDRKSKQTTLKPWTSCAFRRPATRI